MASSPLALTFHASNLSTAHVARPGADSDGDATITVEGRPLLEAVRATTISHVDVMKIDIEGHEAEAPTALFATADRSLWPEGVIFEARRGDLGGAGLQVLLARGYRVESSARMNAMLRLGGAEVGA